MYRCNSITSDISFGMYLQLHKVLLSESVDLKVRGTSVIKAQKIPISCNKSMILLLKNVKCVCNSSKLTTLYVREILMNYQIKY